MEAHRICLTDHNGQLCAKTSIVHSGEGLTQLLEWLASHGVASAHAAVAIETPRGAVVETLIERGFAVFSINPKQVDRFRDRYTTAGAKDDDRDALVMASALRTDAAAFHRIDTEPPELIRLRELYRTADELRAEMQRFTCRLAQQLNRYYPQLLALCPAANQIMLWDLLELAPLPSAIDRLTPEQVTAVLKTRQIRRFNAEQVLDRLRVPALHLAPGAAAAASEHALVLVRQLRTVHELRKLNLQRLDSVLRQMRQARTESATPTDAEIIASLPGAGVLTTAALLAESSQAVAGRNLQALRSYAGVAPVTRQSGKRAQVGMRYASNQRLRNALYHHALCSLANDPVARRHYNRLRAAGHSHPRALRGLADRWLSVLIAMLRNGSLYDPTQRKAWREARCASRRRSHGRSLTRRPHEHSRLLLNHRGYPPPPRCLALLPLPTALDPRLPTPLRRHPLLVRRAIALSARSGLPTRAQPRRLRRLLPPRRPRGQRRLSIARFRQRPMPTHRHARR